MKLTSYVSDSYSQFGEDGIIQHIYEKIGVENKFAVEFGSSEDLACSNVAHLWKDLDWTALLIEADQTKVEALAPQLNDSCTIMCQRVNRSGAYSIDAILKDNGTPIVDFMSIDVDGNDYHIWEEMTLRPRVLCVEFNPTIPPHISIHQEYGASMMGFGSSLKALIELGRRKRYEFIGATEINAFFVTRGLEEPFLDYERDPMKLFPLTNYSYVVTDFLGSAVAAGKRPPWGFRTPYDGPPLSGEFHLLTTNAEQAMDTYQGKYGEIVRWVQNGQPNVADPDRVASVGGYGPISSRNLLRAYMESEVKAICIAIDHISSPDHIAWIYGEAESHSYHCQVGGGLMALVRSE